MVYQNVGPQAVAAMASSPEGFQAHKYMELLELAMHQDEERLIEGVRGVYGFRVLNGPGGAEAYWVVHTKVGKGKITFNGTDKADVTFVVNDSDIGDLLSGKINPQKAFFQGKMKVHGNLALAMKLTDIQRRMPEKIKQLRSKL